MKNLFSCINFARKYTKSVRPIVNKRINEYSIYTDRIKMRTIRSNALESLNKNKFDLAVSSVYCVYPNVDVTLATEVIFSFQAIVQYLDTICLHSSASTESFLKLIFSSLKDALTLRTEDYEKYFTFFPSKDDDGYLSILVEKCRQKVRLLPSFDVIRDYISTYLTLYVDLQVTKYSSNDRDKEINLLSWSYAHGQKYSDISNWEFCMAIDSPLSLNLLLALATAPELIEQHVESMSNTLFPYICVIQKILEGYLSYNDDLSTGSINYLFHYSNLKEYEDRIIYFVNKAIGNQASPSDYYDSILKILLSIYITEPKASEGMNRLSSKALLRAGGSGMLLYSSYIRIIKAINRF